MHNPPHPGKILKELYFKPLNLTVTETAKRLAVSRNALSSIINESAGISPEMAIKLGLLLDTTPEIWMNLQSQFDLWKIKNSKPKFSRFKKIIPIRTNQLSNKLQKEPQI